MSLQMKETTYCFVDTKREMIEELRTELDSPLEVKSQNDLIGVVGADDTKSHNNTHDNNNSIKYWRNFLDMRNIDTGHWTEQSQFLFICEYKIEFVF